MTTQVQTLPGILNPRFTYWLDGAVSLLMGAGVAAFATPLTALIGWPLPPAFLLTIGLVLLPWSAFNFWTARAPVLPAPAFTIHMLVDFPWVIGSATLLLIYGPTLSTFGLAFIAVQGLAVGAVGVLKLIGARSMRAGA